MAATRTGTSRAASGLADRIKPRLRGARLPVRKERLAELRAEAREAGIGEALEALLGRHPGLGDYLASVLEFSPFLRSLMLGEPKRLVSLLESAPDRALKRCLTRVGRSWRGGDKTALMQALRLARQEVALLVALADLGGVWDLARVTGALTAFADAALRASVRFALADAHGAGRLALPDADDPANGCGWIILGMGKYGAGELNYSSDIDLIVLFDPEVAPLPDPDDGTTIFVRLTKLLIQLLNEHTEDGYVFRVDLRLRPDPGATQIAMSTPAALQYYESFGQNWERAALIKARAVAGDIECGDAFLEELTPYIWRKYLDYAAIADIHSIKRQIHDYRGHAEVAVAGHNLKLGRGGIREIEFFVQTQQLIAGGRNPQLRGRSTVEMLGVLAAGGWIDAEVRDDLVQGYDTLRTIEHCLQMVDDDQTHTLPEDEADLDTIARMFGARSLPIFEKRVRAVLVTVQDRYAELFEAAPSLTSSLGSLVFTGDNDDPETLDTLSRLGYKDPAHVSSTIRGWHYGRYPAMRSSTARGLLTEFVPALLEIVANTDNADSAFAAFDRFLAKLPAGVQLFSLLRSNPELLGLLTTIMATAPRLAETVAQRSYVLDALIEPAFFGRVPSRDLLEERLAATLAEADGYEDILDRTRIFRQEQAFLIGVRVIAGTLDAHQAGRAFADLADLLVTALFDAAREVFEAAHGRIARGRMAIVALGKLGGREMTAKSDLDLIALYDFSEKNPTSSGPRELTGSQYFARLTQRLLAALTAPTAEGTLYEVDFRLRPSGQSGPLATHIDAFVTYQAKDAWTWEHMALTRARVITGDKSLVARARKEIAKIVALPSERRKTRADVLEMRSMIEAEKGGEGRWDLKQAPGGLVDIEFIAQYFELVDGGKHPEILSTETAVALSRQTAARLLSKADSERLTPALQLYQALMQVLRLCVDGRFDPDQAPRGLLDLLARTAAMPDFARLDAHLRDVEDGVRNTFEKIIGKMPGGGLSGKV